MVILLATYTERPDGVGDVDGDLIVHAEGYAGPMSDVVNAMQRAYGKDEPIDGEDQGDDLPTPAQFAMH